MTTDAAVSECERVYRYNVEIRNLRDGSSRLLPPEVFSVIALKARGTGPAEPSRQLLRLKDGEEILEAADLEELRIRLRDKYPDFDYERRLHVQRDREAEERRREAIRGLAELLARAAVDDYLQEVSGASPGVSVPGYLSDSDARLGSARSETWSRLP